MYKQLVVELFCVLAAILRRNPELEFTGAVVAEALIGDALDMFKAVRERTMLVVPASRLQIPPRFVSLFYPK